MRAIVVTGGRPPTWDRGDDPMLWLGDRPVAQHVAEALVRAGVRAVDWVCRAGDGALARFLGNGERWGLEITRHEAADSQASHRLVRAIAADRPADEVVLFGYADRFAWLPPREVGAGEVLFAGGPDRAWSGWGVLRYGTCRELPADPDRAAWLAARVPAAADDVVPLDVRTPVDYLLSNRRALLAVGGGAGLYVSRRAKVHPTAALVAPVAIAAGAEVAAHATVGPYAAVAADCVVDRHAALADAVVQPNTYVGERVRLTRAFLDGRAVVRVGPAGEPLVETGLPVASLNPPPLLRLAPALGGWAVRAVRATVRLGRPARTQKLQAGPA